VAVPVELTVRFKKESEIKKCVKSAKSAKSPQK
jgi:hypothetical protein